jgi:hypothetical protein
VAKKTERELLDDVVQRLVGKLPELPVGLIATAVEDAHQYFEQSRVRDFILLLVERRARIDLAMRAANPELSVELTGSAV